METIGLTPSYCKLCGKEHYPKGDYAYNEFCSYTCSRKVEKIKTSRKILSKINSVKNLLDKPYTYTRVNNIKALCSFIHIKLQSKVDDIDILITGTLKHKTEILKALKKCEKYCKNILT